ncbi:MAG: hypothetical protein KAV87_55590, partial [Desulfobacteraceae bacterium]|nr:hypothetical protein [Desulfobacteraceae bacterium]
MQLGKKRATGLLLLTLGLAYSYISTLSGAHTPPLHETAVEPAFTSIGQLEKVTMQSISVRNSIRITRAFSAQLVFLIVVYSFA